MSHDQILSKDEVAALNMLISIARRDTGQSRRVAGFLLAWWNAQSCGGFDLTDLWGVDKEISQSMMVVLGAIQRVHSYPDTINRGEFKADFENIQALWRPTTLST